MAVAKNAPKRGNVKQSGVTGAEYEVLKTSLIDGRVVHAGAVVKYDGVPGKYLRPVNAAAESVKKQADSLRAEQREVVIKTESINPGAEVQRKLRALDDDRRNVKQKDEFARDEPLPDAERKALEKVAEDTNKQALEQSREAGGVLVQMTGTSPETVIPTDGSGVAPAQDQKAAAVKTGKK